MNPPVRAAVLASPEYPFTPVDAPIKLDQNESSLDLPEALKAKVLEQLQALTWNRYPDLNGEALSAAIGAHDDWPAAGTVAVTGSNVLIALLVQLAGMGARVLTVKPNFALYALDAKLWGAELIEVPLGPDFATDVDALIAQIEAGREALAGRAGPAGVIFVPRPHAPTGSLCALSDIERLAQASQGWLLVVDEAYHQFAGPSAMDIARRHEHVVLLRTFSKAWGLAGARLGYALTSEVVARQLRKLVAPFAVSVFQSVCAQVALAHPQFMHERVAATIAERERVFKALQAHPTWKVLPSAANFLLIRTPDAAQAYASLLSGGVLVRKQDSYFGLQGCIRVTVGTREENDAFLRAAGLSGA
jgi:histidinol-phosphate aminotransferase